MEGLYMSYTWGTSTHIQASAWLRAEFIHSIGMYRMCRFLAILRNIFHSSLLYTLSFRTILPTSIPSSFTSSCQLFLGLPLSLAVYKFIYSTFSKFHFLSFSVHAQTNVIYLTLLYLLQWFFSHWINFFIC